MMFYWNIVMFPEYTSLNKQQEYRKFHDFFFSKFTLGKTKMVTLRVRSLIKCSACPFRTVMETCGCNMLDSIEEDLLSLLTIRAHSKEITPQHLLFLGDCTLMEIYS